MTSATTRTPPPGYTTEQDMNLWHVGHVFVWFTTVDCWVNLGITVSIRPGETVGAAYHRTRGVALPYPHWDIFLIEEV